MKVILFDFDGVLANTEKVKFVWLQEILKRKGVNLPASKFAQVIGKKTAKILQENTTLSEEEQKEILKHRQRTLDMQKIEFFPKIKEQLQQLTQTLGIVTGTKKRLVEAAIQQHKLQHVFSLIVGGEDVSTSKPNPECYFLALEKLNVSAKDVIVVEDSPAGVLAAKKAGCTVFGLLTSVRTLEADEIFATHEELFARLRMFT